ncbi:MAG: PilZ domain-containing protein [Myxococcales bacterium]|nr:PilZ domain-containing protein [Myxococcales bacterium]
MENRRQHTRYEAEVAAEIELDGDTLIGETRDISEGGVAVILAQPLDEGSDIELTLILTQDGIEDPNEEPFETTASVMWAAPTEDGKSMMGLRFEDTAGDQTQRLGRFLSALG